jgi:hypothetical protein
LWCFLSGLYKTLMWSWLVSCSFHSLLRNVMNSWKIASCSWSPRRPSSLESWQLRVGTQQGLDWKCSPALITFATCMYSNVFT